MKKLICLTFCLLIALFFITPTPSLADENTKTIEGAVIVDGRTLLPLRSIFENLGATVNWNPTSKVVVAEKGNTKIELPLNSKKVKVNGVTKTLDVPAKLIGNKTMVPVRFVSESLGAEVSWNKENQYALIKYQGQQIKVLMQQSELQKIKSHALKGTTPHSTKIKVGDTVQKVINTYGKTDGWGLREYYALEYKDFATFYMGYADDEGSFSNYDSKTEIYNITAKFSKAYLFNEIKEVFGSKFERGYDNIPGKVFIYYDLGNYQIYIEATQDVDLDVGSSISLSKLTFREYSIVAR